MAILFKTLRFIARPFVTHMFNLTGDKIDIPEGANLILSNHVTNVDFLLIAMKADCDFMHFVLAENIVRNKPLKKLIELIDDPVVHVKGSRSVNTIREMNKRLKKGNNVMLFPEGNTSFDGRTSYVNEATSKLVRMCASNLVLIKIKGGYLTSPRWGIGLRRGKISMESTTVKADDLKKMSVGEITELINKNIYTDAYEEQSSEKQAYKGKKPCLGIERAIYRCPECGGIGTLKSDNRNVKCECGYSAKFNPYGYLVNKAGEEHAIKEYVTNQRVWLEEKIMECDSGIDKAVSIDNDKNIDKSMKHDFSVTNESVYLFGDTVNVFDVTDRKNIIEIGRIKISAFSDYIVCKKNDLDESVVYYKDIKTVTVFKANTLTVFIAGLYEDDTSERMYEIKGDFSFNALKYRDLFEILNN